MNILEKFCFFLLLTSVDSRLKEQQHQPCTFNPLCTCSNGGPDLGSVSCHNIPFMTLPTHINNSAIYIMSLKYNKLRFLEDNSLNGTELWKLQIKNNLLTDLPPNALAGLEKTLSILDLSQNQLIRIPKEAIQHLQKLNNLNLASNHITLLNNDDFKSIGKTLKLLDLSNNALMHIQTDALRNMVALEILNLAFNMIVSVDNIIFQNGLTNLKHIILMGNQLQQMPLNALANLKNIQIVNLNDNMISTISEGRETRNRIYLEELHLERNYITELGPQSFRLFSQINRLFLGGNPIVIVNDTFLTINATEIYMQHCKISFITPNAFYSVAYSLQILDMSYNNLNEFPSFKFSKLVWLSLTGNEINEIVEEHVKSYARTLKYLDIRGPKMAGLTQEIIMNLPNLREYLFSKKLHSVGEEYLSKSGSSMEKLSITRSSIQILENGAFQNLNSLKELDLSYNSVTQIADDTFKEMRHALIKLTLHKALRMSTFPYKTLTILSKLEYLDISGNNLVHMPSESFNAFHNLKYLNLNFNKLKELQPHFINDMNNHNIENIKIAFNKLITLNTYTFRNLKNLVYLQINDNLIKSIKKSAFLDLNSVLIIDLEGNLIESIENEAFQNLPNIQSINLAYNHLSYLNLAAFNQVGRLSTLKIVVAYNNIQNLTSDYVVTQTSSNIKSLNFSYNNISLLDSNYFDPIRMSVVTLDLSQNKIENLTASAFTNMPHLQILIITNNRITTIDENELNGIITLQILELSNNYITSFPKHLFQEQTKLRIFTASHNYIEELPEEIFQSTILEELDISYNKFDEFPQQSIAPLKSTLQFIDISRNNIQSLNFSNFQSFQNLRYLSLSHNKISIPNLGENMYLSKLIYLDLSHNPMIDLPDLPSSLEILNLANTTLKNIPFLNISNILHLNLSSNMIGTIKNEAIEQLQKIRTLDISNNLLSTTYNNIWSNLQNLRTLYLQDNPIYSLSNTSFDDMGKLQQLFIKDLKIQDIPKDVFHPLVALRKLEMSTYPEKDIQLSEMLSRNHGIQEIHLHVQENELGKLFDENLSKSVQKITLEGKNLRHIDESRFASIQSPHLVLVIRNTNITKLSQHLFQNMKEVKNLTAFFINNKLQTIERMYMPHEKQISKNYLKNVKFSENKLYCNCDLSWIWDWMKEYEYENQCDTTTCEETHSEDLRDVKCINMDDKSIIDVFKTELDCFSTSSTVFSLQPHYLILFNLIILYSILV